MEVPDAVLAAFQVEYKEQLEGIRRFLSAHSGPAAQLDLELLHESFRLAHSFKAGARVCNLAPLEQLGHDLESLFQELREGRRRLEGSLCDTIDLVLDAIEDWMAELEPDRQPSEPAAAMRALRAALEDREPAESGPAEADGPDGAGDPEPAAVADADPGPAAPPAPEPARAACAEPTSDGPADRIEMLRVRADALDALLHSADRIACSANRQDSLAEDLETLCGLTSALLDGLAELGRGARGRRAPTAPSPERDRVQRLRETLVPLGADLVRRCRSVQTRHEGGRRELRKLSVELRQRVRLARLVSASLVLQGFRRLFRELAREHGKTARLELQGLEVEADRMVLEALKSPILHMLRNSIAHGVPGPGSGETAPARVALTLSTEGSQLVVRLEGDGPGLDLERIAERAVHSGVLTPQEAEQASEEELADLVFHPGLSTAPEVDGLSGRGMGLADVRETVRRLCGTVEVSSRRGEGTAFEVRAPLSLATQHLLLVAAGGRTFALPAEQVHGLVRLAADELQAVLGRGYLQYGERVVPLVELAALLGLESGPALEREAREGPAKVSVVLARVAGEIVALEVDHVRQHVDAVVRAIRGPAGALEHLAGGIGLDDGSVVPVLDVAVVVRGVAPGSARPADRPGGRPRRDGPARAARRILIVDDSFTTRTLEKSLLEAHGYEVLIAVDGREAVGRLQTDEVDLVISDVEMPHLDGFGLLEAIRENPRTAALPVIMVTSMDRPEDHQRGLDMGASAYISKKQFDQQGLLETVEQLI